MSRLKRRRSLTGITSLSDWIYNWGDIHTQLHRFWAKSCPKRHQQIVNNSIPKNYPKMMPKGSKRDWTIEPKWIPKSSRHRYRIRPWKRIEKTWKMKPPNLKNHWLFSRKNELFTKFSLSGISSTNHPTKTSKMVPTCIEKPLKKTMQNRDA